MWVKVSRTTIVSGYSSLPKKKKKDDDNQVGVFSLVNVKCVSLS